MQLFSLIICFAKFTDPIHDVSGGNHPDGIFPDCGFRRLEELGVAQILWQSGNSKHIRFSQLRPTCVIVNMYVLARNKDFFCILTNVGSFLDKTIRIVGCSAVGLCLWGQGLGLGSGTQEGGG